MLSGAGDHFCAGADIVARNAGDRATPTPAGRQHPAPAAVAGPPADPAVLDVRPRRVPGAGLGRRHRVPARAGRRLHRRRRPTPRSGSRSPSAGFTPDSGATWLLPRLVGRGAGPRAAAARPRARRRRGRGVGARPPRGAGRPSSTRAVDELVDQLGDGPDGRARAHQVAAARRAEHRRSTTQLQNEAFALELSSRSEDFREGLARLRREAPARVQGPMSATVTRLEPPIEPIAIDAGTSADEAVATPSRGVGRRARARGLARRGRAGRRGGDPRGPLARRLRGLVPGVRRVRAGRADLAGRLRRPRPERGPGPRRRGRARARSTSAGSTRSASTWPRRRCSPTAPRSSACASCRRSCATRRCGASCSASPAPAATSPRSPRGPSATATSGSSPGRRCGPPGRTWPTSACCSPAPTPTRPKRKGITYFLVDLHQPGVEVRPLPPHHRRDRLQRGLPRRRPGARLPSGSARSATAGGSPTPRCRASARWCRARARAASTASAGRARPGSIRTARDDGRVGRPAASRQELMRLHSEERIRGWTNQRVRAGLKAGRPPGPGELDRQGAPGRAQPAHPAAGHRPARRRTRWRGRATPRPTTESLPYEVQGHAAQPGQHHRGRHHRGQQEHRRPSGCSACPASPTRGTTRPWRDVPRVS